MTVGITTLTIYCANLFYTPNACTNTNALSQNKIYMCSQTVEDNVNLLNNNTFLTPMFILKIYKTFLIVKLQK